MKNAKIIILVLLSALITNMLLFSCSFAGLKEDYSVENVSGMILNRKYISNKYNISILFPSSWEIVSNLTGKYSVVKIRSEQGSGLENLNITVIPSYLYFE